MEHEQEKVPGTNNRIGFLTPSCSLWTANGEVPKDGCPSSDESDSRIKENIDDKKPRKKKTAAEAAK